MDAWAERSFITAVERIMLRLGYTHSEGKVYAVLLLNGNPMKIHEIMNATGLSRSTVSTALSRLSRDYLVVTRVEGRKKLFSALPGFLAMFLKQPREMLEHEVKPALQVLEVLNVDGAVLYEFSDLRCLLEEILRLESRVKCGSRSPKEKT